MKIQKRLNSDEAKALGINPLPRPTKGNPQYRITPDQLEKLENIRAGVSNSTKTSANDYPNRSDEAVVMSAWGPDGKMMGLDDYCKHYNLPREQVTSHKLVSHTGTPYYNIVFKEQISAKSIEDFDFDKILGKFKEPARLTKKSVRSEGSFDRAIITDVHIGMEPNPNGLSLYGGKWDSSELFKRAELTAEHIIKNRTSKLLILDDLGDLMDGFKGQTVRQGHELPQNMTDEEAFDLAISFKISLIDMLAPYFDKITMHNICDDNHSGAFGYMVNSAFKKYIEARYDFVKVVNVKLFLYHYFVGKNCFIITHGKDGKNLKFGFKPILDAQAAEKITDYIKEHGLDGPEIEIQFDKGDSHQFIFDWTTSDLFDYFNYPAFSPSSNWVQTNYKKGRSGMVLFNYSTDGSRAINPLFFSWERNRSGIEEHTFID